MMRSGRSDPRMMVREVEDDDNEVDNEDQDAFVLHGAGPDNNLSFEKRSGLEIIFKFHFFTRPNIHLISREIERMERIFTADEK